MPADKFDKVLWLLVMVVLTALAATIAKHSLSAGNGSPGTGASKAMEKEMAFQARVSLLQKIYAPVEDMRQRGDLQGALLRLDELNRSYPGEAHGYILKGEILNASGAVEEAIASYVQGIKISGDYIDRKNALSRRDTIKVLADKGHQLIGARARANPGNKSLAAAMSNVNYLKSRLAGGCE